MRAVNKESCRGEMLLVEIMLQVTGFRLLVKVAYNCKLTSDQLQATSNYSTNLYPTPFTVVMQSIPIFWRILRM